MGSVKDLKVVKAATIDTPGEGRFTFSDRYSVFDWGEMPDEIDHKGAAIALMGAYFFEKTAQLGIASHYRGLVEEGEVKKLAELKGPSNVMAVDLVRVVHPQVDGQNYDYTPYRHEKGNLLIPLEVIYRNNLPPGSSVFKRLKDGHITPQDLGLAAMPSPNQRLDPPIYDVSTKLEVTDRYLTWDEARTIAGLDGDEIQGLKSLTKTVNELITQEFGRMGMVNEDGKIEVGFDPRRKLMLVDVFGTLDECRFTLDGLPVSKEIARIHYRDSTWSRDVEAAKQEDRQNWKRICRSAPEPLPKELSRLVSQVYCACANELTGREWFADLPSIRTLMQTVKGIMDL